MRDPDVGWRVPRDLGPPPLPDPWTTCMPASAAVSGQMSGVHGPGAGSSWRLGRVGEEPDWTTSIPLTPKPMLAAQLCGVTPLTPGGASAGTLILHDADAAPGGTIQCRSHRLRTVTSDARQTDVGNFPFSWTASSLRISAGA